MLYYSSSKENLERMPEAQTQKTEDNHTAKS